MLDALLHVPQEEQDPQRDQSRREDDIPRDAAVGGQKCDPEHDQDRAEDERRRVGERSRCHGSRGERGRCYGGD